MYGQGCITANLLLYSISVLSHAFCLADAKSNACMEAKVGAQPAASTATDETRDTEMDAVLEVRQYCLQRKEVDLDVASLHFADLATAELARCGPCLGPRALMGHRMSLYIGSAKFD